MITGSSLIRPRGVRAVVAWLARYATASKRTSFSKKGSLVPPKLHLQTDPRLSPSTIVTSFRTARELRSIVGPETYQIESQVHFPDELITVSPDLYDAFQLFIANLSDSHHAV
jgi:hypothetical protein